MQKISDNLGKYKEINVKKRELEQIRADIFKQTNIKPVSIKLLNGTLTIKTSNNYEAIEVKNNISLPRYNIRVII